MKRHALFLVMVGAAHAAVLDRVAVTIGKDVVTESEVMEEIRLTDFQNQSPLDVSPKARLAAAERMVDQDLIRVEMKLENFAPPPAGVDQTLREFKQAHFRTHAQYLASLRKYGITEDQLKRYLVWQLAALRFTDQRFHAEKIADTAVDEPMDAWLKETRAQTKIQFHQEALE